MDCKLTLATDTHRNVQERKGSTGDEERANLKKQSRARQVSCELDSCWSWIVCASCTLCNIIICGVPFSYGILFPALLDEFHQGKATTALVGSLAIMGAGLYSIFAARVYNRIGPIKTGSLGIVLCIASLALSSQGTSIYFLLISHGFFFGIASCFVYLPPFLTIPRYFDKRRALALAIVSVGPGAGLFILSPIAQALLDALGWRRTFMTLAGIIAIILPLLCVFRRMPDEQRLQQNKPEPEKGKLCDFSVLKSKHFVIYTLATSLMFTGHYTPTVHMVRYCEEIGIPPIQSSKFYIYSGVTSMLIRPVIGRLCDMKRIHPCYFFQVAAAVTGTATLPLPLARNNLHFVLYFILYGAADGTMNSAMTVAVMFCFTGEKRVQAFGLYRSVTNVASAVGPSLGGFVADSFGSYSPTFYLAGSVIVVSGLLIFVVPFMKQNEEEKGKEEEEEVMV